MRSLKPYRSTTLSVSEALKLLESIPLPIDPVKKDSKAPARAKSLSSNLDFLVLEDISCVDADGHIFEHYDRLEIGKDIFRDSDGKPVYRTPYAHAVSCEEQGVFLPSIALSCNIVARLFAERNDGDVKKVLDQYKDKGEGNGWHAQNTVINYASSEVIHYPSAADFSKKNEVNASQSTMRLPFSKSSLQNALLKDALCDTSVKRYVCQLTGLQDPEILVEIGKYFAKPVRLWFPWNGKLGDAFKERQAAWFGCYDINFNLDGNYDLSNYDAARGVRRRVGERSEPGAGGAK